MVTISLLLTTRSPDAPELHKSLLINVKNTVPGDNVVTTPLFVIVAIISSLLSQVPPIDGVNCVFSPTQTSAGPEKEVSTTSFIVILRTEAPGHPVVESVYEKLAIPSLIPVTVPLLETVAMEGSLLSQIPPKEGDKLVVSPSHI